jgi:hypothetical protein
MQNTIAQIKRPFQCRNQTGDSPTAEEELLQEMSYGQFWKILNLRKHATERERDRRKN